MELCTEERQLVLQFRSQSKESIAAMEEVNSVPMSSKNHDHEKLPTDDAATQYSDAKPATSEVEPEDEKQYPGLGKVIPILAAIYLSLFLISLVDPFDNIPRKVAKTYQNFRIAPSSPPPSRELLTNFTL